METLQPAYDTSVLGRLLLGLDAWNTDSDSEVVKLVMRRYVP